MKRVRVEKSPSREAGITLFSFYNLESLANGRELVNQSIWFADACAPNRKQDTTVLPLMSAQKDETAVWYSLF